MISKEDHERVVSTYLQVGSWLEGGGRDSIMSLSGLPRSVHKRLDHEARRTGKSKGSLVRDSMIKEMLRSGTVSREDVRRVENRQEAPPPGLTDEDISAMHSAFRESRVFEVPAAGWRVLSESISKYAYSQISSLIETEHGPEHLALVELLMKKSMGEKLTEREAEVVGKDGPRDEINEILRSIYENLSSQPVPEQLPFDVCYFAPSEPLPLKDVVVHALGLGDFASGHEKSLVGLVVSRDIVFEVFAAMTSDAVIEYRPVVLMSGGVWSEIWVTRGPWLVEALVSIVNEHRTLVEERPRGLSDKLLWQKIRKRGAGMKMPAPPPFYIVNLTASYVKENRRKIFPSRPRNWQHRWDVRGHEVVRVCRGSLPLLEKVERDLRRRRYKIYVGPLDADGWKIFSERGMEPKRTGEWVAILTYFRKDFVKGPKDKPYVASVHRVSDRGSA